MARARLYPPSRLPRMGVAQADMLEVPDVNGIGLPPVVAALIASAEIEQALDDLKEDE